MGAVFDAPHEVLSLGFDLGAIVMTSKNTSVRGNDGENLPRLSFTLKETSQMLGISYMTGFRLLQRGKLRSCGGLRTKLITKTEIERYLRENQEEVL